MVRVVDKCLHELEVELDRWQDILRVEYAEYQREKCMFLHPTV